MWVTPAFSLSRSEVMHASCSHCALTRTGKQMVLVRRRGRDARRTKYISLSLSLFLPHTQSEGSEDVKVRSPGLLETIVSVCVCHSYTHIHKDIDSRIAIEALSGCYMCPQCACEREYEMQIWTIYSPYSAVIATTSSDVGPGPFRLNGWTIMP